MSLQAGTRIGHYEIQSALGAGGMGEVARLHRTEPNPLINRRNSDAMPNGTLLGISIDLAAEGSGEATRRDQIAVVLNWPQTLPKNVPH